MTKGTEVIKDRRINGKTFDMGNGKFKSVTHMEGMVHYKNDMLDDNEPFKEIDLTIDAHACCNKAPYQIRIYTDKVGYTYRSKIKGRVDVELVEIGGQPVDNNRFTVRIKGDQLFWDNVADDIDMRSDLRSYNVEIFKQLRTANAARKLKWLIREDVDSSCSFVKLTEGVDSAKPKPQLMEIHTVVGRETIKTSKETGNKFKQYYYEEIWTGRISKIIDRSSRRKVWSDDVVYPCIIDALTTENITNTADDGMTKTSVGTWSSAGGPFMGVTAGGIWNTGLRFQTLGIPQGSTIDDANLVVNKLLIGNTPQLKIYADDVDDAPAWSNSSRPGSGFTKTTASKTWSPTVTGAESIPITSIVQEIISRGSWAPGNDIRFGIFDQVGGSASNYASIAGYPTNEAQLVINFTAAGFEQTSPLAITASVPTPTVITNIESASPSVLAISAALLAPVVTVHNPLTLEAVLPGHEIIASIPAVITVEKDLPILTLEATCRSGQILTLSATLPAHTLVSHMGMQAEINLLALTLSSTLTSGGVASVKRKLPALTLSANMTSGRVLTLSADLPALILSANILNGNVLTLAQTLAAQALEANATGGDNMSLTGDLLALTLVSTINSSENLTLVATLPALELEAFTDNYLNRYI